MFSYDIIKDRICRGINALEEFDIDLWISIGRDTNIGTEPALYYMLPSDIYGVGALILTKTGESICMTGRLHYEEMQKYGAATQNVLFVSQDELDEKLTKIIGSARKNGRIALNFSDADSSADGLSFTQYKRIQRSIQAAGFKGEVVSSHRLMKRVRAQKSEAEVAKIENTVLKAMKVFNDARSFIRAGVSGRDIQRFFHEKVYQMDAEYSWEKAGDPYCSIGTRSSYLCVRPSDDVYAQPGDLINVDFGLRIDGFASDNQRSYYVLRDRETQEPEELRHAFNAVSEAIRAAVAAMKPGVHTMALSEAANEVFLRYGYPEIGRLGHEIGTLAHEGGISSGYDGKDAGLDYMLEEGMTFTMEPAIITSCGRLCQEEVVAVTRDGGCYLSTPQEKVWLVR